MHTVPPSAVGSSVRPRGDDAVVGRLIIAGMILFAAVPAGCVSAERGRDPEVRLAGGTTGAVTSADRRAARAVRDEAWGAWRRGDVRDAVDVIAGRLADRSESRRAGLVAALRIEAEVGDAAAWRIDGSEARDGEPGVPGVPAWVAAASVGVGPAAEPDRRGLAELMGSIAGGGSASIGRVAPRVHPEDAAEARTRFERAAAAIAAGRAMQAVVDLQEAGRLDPTQASIPRSLARVAEGLGNIGLARRAWQDVVSIDPADPEGLLALAADALRSDRPLAALALLQRLDPAAAGDASEDPVSASDAWCRDALLLEVCERLGADAAIGEVAERMLASAVDLAAARRAALERNIPEAAIGRLGVARRLGDARWRAGRPADADAAYAIAAAVPAGGSATDRRERAAVLVRRVALASTSTLMSASAKDRSRDLGRFLRAAAGAAPDDATPLVLAMDLLEPSPASVRVLAAVTAEIEPSVAARATGATVAWPGAGPTDERVGGPIAFGPVRRIERLHPGGPPWPHPLPEAADVAARRLLRASRPLSGERPAGVSASVHAAILEACGWIGRAYDAVDRTVRRDEPVAGDPSTAELAAAHVMRIRLAGLLQEPDELARVIAEARAVRMPKGWEIRREMAAATAQARIGRLDAAVRTAADLVDAVDAVDAAGPPDASDAANATDAAALSAAARLTLAAALVERATVVRGGPEAGRDLRTAIELASAVRRSRPEDAAAWMLVEAVLAPTGPVPDPAAAARQRRQWAELADRLPAAAREADRLERARLMLAGRFDAVDDAARLRLLMDPLDETAIEDLLTARARAGRSEESLRWLERRQRRHPADPAAAAARLRSDAEAGRAMEAWSRLERRLTADPDDLVALRLSEAAAGFAGDRMMQLVMAETRLLERPPGPHRALLLARASAAAGQSREALGSLRTFVAAAASATDRDLAAAASLLSRIRGGGDSSPGVPAAPAGSTETARAAMAMECGLAEAVLPRLGADVPSPAARPGAATVERIVIGGMSAGIVGGEPPARFLSWVDRLAGHAARTGMTDTDAWRRLAAESLEAGRGFRASALIIRRVSAGPEGGAALAPLLRLAVATDAASVAGFPPADDADAGRATASLLEDLAAAGRLPGPEDAASDPLAEAFREAALVHQWLGSDAAARRLLAAALDRRPDDPALLNDLGYARLEAAIAAGRVVGEAPAIAGLIEAAHDRDPANPAILDSLGWLRYRQGRIAGGPGDALDLLERADAAADSPSAEVRLHLGDARWRAGRREAAVEAWTAASMVLADPAVREGFEREVRRLQLETWGVLVRDPAAMYDSRFGRIDEALRRRLEAWRSGADAIPVVPTDAEVSPAGDGP